MLRDIVLAVPGVSRLHAGRVGEVATYLPGRRVTGVRWLSDHVELHLVTRFPEAVADVVDRVRSAATPLVDVPLDIVVADIDSPDEPDTHPSAPPDDSIGDHVSSPRSSKGSSP